MKHKFRFLYAGIFTFVLLAFTAYTLLDAFVIPQVLTKMRKTAAQSPAVNPVYTDNSYTDQDISITITSGKFEGAMYYVADVKLTNIYFMKTALANNTYGKNIKDTTSHMAEQHNAIFAVNGDFYGFRDMGLTIRNGVLLRDNPVPDKYPTSLLIDADGNLSTHQEGSRPGQTLIEEGIWQGFTFGPALVLNGRKAGVTVTRVPKVENPRMAIGQLGKLHYIFVAVDGRTRDSTGLTLSQLERLMVSLGCQTAYNLDGGGSATMWFNGSIVNVPTNGKTMGERSISDIVYIGRS